MVYEVFRQTDALREEISGRLNANPDDAEALRLLGESRLNEDKLAEAVHSLRRAYQLKPKDTRTQDLLRKALLEGLRRDFATYGVYAADIDRLLDDTQTAHPLLAADDRGVGKSGAVASGLRPLLALAGSGGQRSGFGSRRPIVVGTARSLDLRPFAVA